MKIRTFIATYRTFGVILVLSILFSNILSGQNQKLTDSLEIVYVQGDYQEQNKLALLKQLAVNHPDPEKKLVYANELLSTAKVLDSSQYLYSAYLEMGNSLYQTGNFPESIDNYLEAGDIALKENEQGRFAIVLGSVSTVYQAMDNLTAAVTYSKRSLSISEKIVRNKRDSLILGTTIENLGYIYLKLNKPDSALIYFDQSGKLFEKTGYEEGLAYNVGNKGLAFAQLKEYDNAEKNINRAIESLESFGHHMGTSELLTEISEIYLLNNEFDLATESAYRSLHLAKMNNLKPQISDAYKLLSEIYEKSRKGDQALDNYKNYIIYRDSVKNLSSIQEIANMRTDFEVSQKQTEVDLLNRQKKTQQILVFTMLASLLITVVYFKNISRAKKRSDELLLNILPSKTAEELKKNGKVEAKKFESASVMFTDFQAFTKYSQKLTPEILVKSVDYFFCQFDRIIEKYQLEKIKTIGDAYMCAGGIPKENQHHAVDIIFAAFEIIDFINESKENKDKEIAHFDIRIGINTGPVVAGVVGEKKFAYDIWGDTVNVASRMETNSIPGMINISEDTYALVKDYFECEYRGEIEVKNKGMMKMYFVKGKKNSNQNSNDASDKIVLC